MGLMQGDTIMTTVCSFCSGSSEGFVARAADVIANWWTEYTVLHNRGLMEAMLRQKYSTENVSSHALH